MSLSNLSLDFSEMPLELKRQALLDLKEENSLVEISLKNFKILIKGSREINFYLQDCYLMPFLRARKFDVEKAHLLLLNHISMIQKHDLLFNNFKFSSLQRIMLSNSVGCLPKRDVDGCIVVVFFLDKWNHLEIPVVENVRAVFLGVLAALRFPITQITGVKIIQDYTGLTLRKLTYMPPWVFKFAIDCMQNTLPMRVKGLHIVNNGSLFYYIWAMLKPLLSRKIRSRIHFHGNDFKSLHKFISPSILPEELHGDLGPHSNKEWIKFMEDSENYITDYLAQVRKYK